MAFTEQDLKNQKQEITRLADELSRLNSVFAEQKKAEITPELEKAMAEATERAKREGEARAAQAKLAAGPSTTGGRSRRGAMRI